jgi:hypothetical protein
MIKHVRQIASTFLAVLREIFDESAYERFLQREDCQSSPEAYSAFLCEHQALKARRPRCC